MKIGIAVDGSPQSTAGIDLVSSLPISGSDEISVVAVAEPPMVFSGARFGHVPSGAGFAEVLLEDARARAQQIVERAAERLIGCPCPVRPMIRVGHPIDCLQRVAAEEDLDLLTVGPRGTGSVASLLLGSVSQALLHAMPTSVLVARPPTRTPRQVILAIDGSAPSLDAARFLAGFRLPADVDIRVLVAVTAWTREYASLSGTTYNELLAAERQHAAEVAEQGIAVLAEHGRHSTALIRDGDPKREILDAARELDADLIVTGARGIGGFKGLVLGSVSRGVSKAAPCSTLVVARSKTSAAE